MKSLGISALIAVAVLVVASGASAAVAVSDGPGDSLGYAASGVSTEGPSNGLQQFNGSELAASELESGEKIDGDAWPTEFPDQLDPAQLAPVPEPVSIVIWSVAGGLGAGAALAARRGRRRVRGRWSEESRRAIFEIIEGKRRD